MSVYAVDIEQQPITLPGGPFPAGSATWVQVRPNLRRLHVLAGDIMAGYGKRHDLSGKGRNEHEDIAHAVAWLQAYGSPALVVVDAQWLHHLILRRLVQLAQDADVELWLLHRGERTDIFDRALLRHQAHTAPASAVPAALCPDAAERPAATFPAVPADDFHTFLASCRRRLTPADLVLVERRLQAAVARCQAGFPDPAPPAAVARLLDDLLHEAPDDASSPSTSAPCRSPAGTTTCTSRSTCPGCSTARNVPPSHPSPLPTR